MGTRSTGRPGGAAAAAARGPGFACWPRMCRTSEIHTASSNFFSAKSGDLYSLQIRQSVLRVRIRLAPPFSLLLQRLPARTRAQPEKSRRFRGVLAVEPSRIRTVDCRFRAQTRPRTAFVSVANLGGSDSLSIRLARTDLRRANGVPVIGGRVGGIELWRPPNDGESGRTCSADLLSPALRWGESKAKPNRPTWQQRQTRDAVSSRPGTRSLRFGYARAWRPRPRGIAGISQAVPECAREISATAD